MEAFLPSYIIRRIEKEKEENMESFLPPYMSTYNSGGFGGDRMRPVPSHHGNQRPTNRGGGRYVQAQQKSVSKILRAQAHERAQALQRAAKERAKAEREAAARRKQVIETVMGHQQSLQLSLALSVLKSAPSSTTPYEIPLDLFLDTLRCAHLHLGEDALWLLQNTKVKALRLDVSIFSSFSLRTPVDLSLRILKVLFEKLPNSDFSSSNARAYFEHYCPLMFDDLLTSSLSSFSRAVSVNDSSGGGFSGGVSDSERGSPPLRNVMVAIGGEGFLQNRKLVLKDFKEAGRLSGEDDGRPPQSFIDCRVGDVYFITPETSQGFSEITDSCGDVGIEVEVQSVAFNVGVTVKLLSGTGNLADLLNALKRNPCRGDKVSCRVTFLRQLEALVELSSEKASKKSEGMSNGSSQGCNFGFSIAHRNTILSFPLITSVASAPTATPTPIVHTSTSAQGGVCPLVPGVGLRGMEASAWRECVFTTKKKALESGGRLNPSQIQSVCEGLTSSFSLTLGPPGCGKTSTAAHLIAAWLEAGIGPILATADSNTAVDNLLDSLTKWDSPLPPTSGFSIVRVGRSEAVRQDLMKFSLEGMAPAGSSKETVSRIQRTALKGAAVVCATSSVAGGGVLDSWKCAAVLIDEASQATEPSLLVPIACGAPRFVALFGDNRQLPPTIVSRTAELNGLAVSLYDRLSQGGAPVTLLNTQYRMHPTLAAFPSMAFYEGRVGSGVCARERVPPPGFPWPQPHTGLAFVGCPEGSETSSGTSHFNGREASRVVEIALGFLSVGGGIQPHHIGIVTPYASQVRQINRMLPHGLRGLIEVGSVDGFQGREKEVIIFSAVRANFHGNVGFLADERRVNVMLTRARRALVVVGHGDTLRQEDKCWGRWMRWMQDGGFIVPEPLRLYAPAPPYHHASAVYQTKG